MLFLLNDVVLRVEAQTLSSALDLRRFGPLRLALVSQLGQEAFSEEPLLHHSHPDRAARLASLILAKAPQVNAALFLAPCTHCPPEHVSFRYAQIDFDVMSDLYSRQQARGLSTLDADRLVWRRLAA